jgi:predicted nucleotidyltransferase
MTLTSPRRQQGQPSLALRAGSLFEYNATMNSKSYAHYAPSRLLSPDELNAMRRAIRRYARQIAERFQPDKIILFGSFAYGTPDTDSDVDLLVVMPARDPVSQMVRICMALELPPFSMDMLVRSPEMLRGRLEMGDSFLREVVSGGKVLYANGNESGSERRRRTSSAPASSSKEASP